jgi:type IV pilus assembly protein PilW
VVHDKGNNLDPGNCSKGLGYPTDCSNANGSIYAFPPNSQIAKLSGHVWYIGTNAEGGRSLYLLNAINNGGSISITPQEMVRNVTDMQITYDQPPGTSFGKAADVTDWSVVASARITLSLQSTDQRAGVNAKPIKRQYAATTTLRNRVQ